VVHSGDVFDRSRPPSRAVVEAEALLRAAARWATVLLIPGNHDRRGLRRWLPHPSLQVHDAPARVVVGGAAFGLVPFRRTAERFAADAAAVGEGVDVLVVHQAVHGARVPGLVFREGEQADTLGARHLPGRWGRCGVVTCIPGRWWWSATPWWCTLARPRGRRGRSGRSPRGGWCGSSARAPPTRSSTGRRAR
jgi:hypothetical protein